MHLYTRDRNWWALMEEQFFYKGVTVDVFPLSFDVLEPEHVSFERADRGRGSGISDRRVAGGSIPHTFIGCDNSCDCSNGRSDSDASENVNSGSNNTESQPAHLLQEVN